MDCSYYLKPRHIVSSYKDHLELKDVGGKEKTAEGLTLTRCLSAFVMDSLSGCGAARAGGSVTDGGKDNGLDAVYVDPSSETIYLVQSKWIYNGKGEPSNADVKKFIAGIKDILNCRFHKFNERVKSKEVDLTEAMGSPKSKLIGVLAYTGINDLAAPSKDDISDLLDEVNDVSSYLSFRVLNQSDLYAFLSREVDGDPIDIDVGLKAWGTVKEPSLAFYGQVNGQELKAWWDKYGVSILRKNIRGSLGYSEVNEDISQTIKVSPDKFWYYNNGITIIAKRVKKTLLGGGDRDHGTFRCENVSVVNGAQTLSTIGSVDSVSSNNLSRLSVPLRIISLENGESDFGEKITKSNNLQNRIESRDFVSLDQEQQRLRLELRMDGVDYSIKRESGFVTGDSSFDLFEATTALACASGDVGIIVQLKREVGRVWDDISRPPYTKIFNAGVTSVFLYRCVLASREIDRHINKVLTRSTIESGLRGVGVHGNRIVSGLVFSCLSKKNLCDPSVEHNECVNSMRISEITERMLFELSKQVSKNFSGTVLPTLFKNRKKCQMLFDLCAEGVDKKEGGGYVEADGQMSLI